MKEEKILNEIIKSCNLILDELSIGAEMSEADFNNLGYIEGAIRAVQRKVDESLDYQIIEDVRKAKENKQTF